MEKEIWQNSTAGTRFVVRFDHKGDFKHEGVRSGQKVVLSTEERHINMERAASPKLDPFTNGSFTPVKLADGVEDAHEIASNPNLKSESELRDLFKLQWQKFDKEISSITNPHALERLRQIAEEEDATVRQMRAVEDRIAEVNPAKFVEVTAVGEIPGGDTVTGKGVSPR